MQKLLKEWKSCLQTIFVSWFLLMFLSVSVFAAENVPSGDELPTVSSPANGVLLIEGVQENILIRVLKDGEVFTSWRESYGEDETFLYEPLGEGVYSVEVCYVDAIEESDELDRTVPEDKITVAKWDNGALSGRVNEPAAQKDGNAIDLSQAVYSEEYEAGVTYFSADTYVTEHNLMRMWDGMLGIDPDYREKLLPEECRYYSLGETMENGAHIWYRIDPSEAVTFVTSAKTDCVVEQWKKFDDFNMILERVQTTGYINFNSANVSVTVKGDNKVGGLYLGDGEDTIVIQGNPADGLDTLCVEGGGIHTNGNQIMISDLAHVYVSANEESAVYMSDENGQITIRDISGDVFLRSECYANSAITAYTSHVRIENIGGDVTISAKGGNGVEADGNVFISYVNGTVKIISEEASGIFVENDIRITDVEELLVVTNAVQTDGVNGCDAIYVCGDVILQNIEQVTVKGFRYGVNTEGIFRYGEEDVYEGDRHSIMLDNVNAAISGGECALYIIGDVKVTADDGVTVKSGETAAAKELSLTDALVSVDEVGKYLSVQSKTCGRGSSCPLSRFKDLDAKQWYYGGVHYCLENNLMSGYSESVFGPADDTSRGMVVAILYRLEGTPQTENTNQFTDVAEDAYYHDAILWAEENGIVSGYDDGRFAPDDAITREQMVSVLYRYAQYKGYDVSVGENTNILSYDDAFDISQYAVPAMQWACGADIVSGNEDHTLNPLGYAQRVHTAQMLMKFLKN